MDYFIASVLVVFLVAICFIVDSGLKRISNKLTGTFRVDNYVYTRVDHSFPPHPLNDIHYQVKTDKIRKSLQAIEEHLFTISESLKGIKK